MNPYQYPRDDEDGIRSQCCALDGWVGLAALCVALGGILGFGVVIGALISRWVL